MIGQEIHTLESRQAGGEGPHPCKVILIIVDPRDDRNPQDNAMTSPREILQILKNRLVRYARELSMPCPIHQLEVV
jgi:hypothetical protein